MENDGVGSVEGKDVDWFIVSPGAVGCTGLPGSGGMAGGISATDEGLGCWNTQS